MLHTFLYTKHILILHLAWAGRKRHDGCSKDFFRNNLMFKQHCTLFFCFKVSQISDSWYLRILEESPYDNYSRLMIFPYLWEKKQEVYLWPFHSNPARSPSSCHPFLLEALTINMAHTLQPTLNLMELYINASVFDISVWLCQPNADKMRCGRFTLLTPLDTHRIYIAVKRSCTRLKPSDWMRAELLQLARAQSRLHDSFRVGCICTKYPPGQAQAFTIHL